MSYPIKLMPWALLSAGLAATLATPVLGQQNRGAVIDNLLRERVRQLNVKTLEKELRKPAKQREQRLAFTQIKEDYALIQSLNQDLAQSVAWGGPLNLKFIAKTASEIKRLFCFSHELLRRSRPRGETAPLNQCTRFMRTLMETRPGANGPVIIFPKRDFKEGSGCRQMAGVEAMLNHPGPEVAGESPGEPA